MGALGNSCTVDGCHKPKEKGREYCAGHRKRAKQGKPLDDLREYGTDPGNYLLAKALQYADVKAEDDEAHRRALKLLKYAAKQYAARCQKVPKAPNTQK
jgi:hypothetical protein